MFHLILLASLMISSSHAKWHSLEKFYISSGKPTSIKAFPYQAALEYKKEQDCGASIIGKDILLTAAHCISEDPDPNNYQIRVGSTDLESGGKVFQVRDFVMHNAFSLLNSDFLRYAFDIAIIWIRGSFDYGKTISPITLPTEDCAQLGAEGIVSGWGRTEKIKYPKELRYAKVTIWDQTKCKKLLGKVKVGIEMFCAGQYKDGSGACKGDSGGPLVVGNKLCGIVSWGEDCGIPGLPEVYTRVSFFLEWIKLALDVGPRRS